MKKILFVILCVCVIFSLLTINCFAFNATFDDALDVSYFMPVIVSINNIGLAFNDYIYESPLSYSIYNNGVGESAVDIDGRINDVTDRFDLTVSAYDTQSNSIYIDFGPFAFYDDDSPPTSKNLTVSSNTTDNDDIVTYYWSVVVDYYNYYSGTHDSYTHFIEGTCIAGDSIDLDLNSLKDYIYGGYLYPTISLALHMSTEFGNINTAFIDCPVLTVKRGVEELRPDEISVTQQVVNPNIVEWLVTSLNSFFGVEIFGDITIGNIFGIALAVPLVIWFLKLFAGG